MNLESDVLGYKFEKNCIAVLCTCGAGCGALEEPLVK